MRYQVIVGNIGTVHETDNGAKARQEYGQCVALSKKSTSWRGHGEDVTLMRDGEPLFEHTGHIQNSEDADHA